MKGFLEVEAVDLGLERRMRIGNGRRREDQWEQRCGLSKSWACMGKIEKEVLAAGWDAMGVEVKSMWCAWDLRVREASVTRGAGTRSAWISLRNSLSYTWARTVTVLPLCFYILFKMALEGACKRSQSSEMSLEGYGESSSFIDS